ncbi:MAG: MYXO-CTERM sorting domain-containing protein, partial [Polyangiaceae bacterium]
CVPKIFGTEKVCRKALGDCDVDEVCDGSSHACPANLLKPTSYQCQALSCTDSNLKPKITCDGTNPSCPVVADVSCGHFACGSSTQCRTTCVTSADCGTAFYCLNNDCIPRVDPGQQCKVDAQCSVSNPHCVDGVCCDTTCVGQCEACNVEGKVGTCVGVQGKPIEPRVLCAADGTNCDGFCDPSNRTACQFPDKATSCRDAACDTKRNAAVAESFCTGKGSCALTDSIACDPYACNGLACAGNCTADAQCAADAYCQAGKCTPKGKPANKCTTDKQCGSGHCADGVCCDTACTGQCEACSGVPDAKAGTCSPVTGAPLGEKPACAAADAVCGGSCDGKNRLSCIYPAQGKVCRPGACVDGQATVNASCDGHGACPAALTIPCTQGCEGSVCAGDECVSDTDCNDDKKYCAAGVCTIKGVPGSACSSASACQTGFCTDGVCCDSACLGQCESCDASGSMGTCSAVPKGDSPHGGRTACASDGSACGGVCDGATRDNCKYPFDVVCRAGACAPGAGPDDPATSILEASCVGNGSCPAEQQQLCGTDGCDSKGKLCDGACAANKNACKAGEYCSAGECVPKRPGASGCANDAQCQSNFCVDGVCCNKRCGDQCAACDVPGSVGTCTPVAGGTHGGRAACGGVGTCAAACDGSIVASCSFAVDVSCGEPFCSAGLRGDAPLCDGAGVCAPAVTTECKSYLCEGAECSTACTLNTDCVKEFECRDGQCVPPRFIDAVDKGSCGCSIPGSTSGTPAGVFFLLGLCAAAAFRRRRLAA